MTEPKFIPKPGQTDYTNIHWAPVMNCVVTYKGKILMMQRSAAMRLYPNVWNGISGFLDDHKSIAEKVKEELREECGIPATKIKSIKLGEIFDQEDKQHKKTWIVHPVLVEVTTDKVKLNWESQDYRWVTRAQVRHLNCLECFPPVLKATLKPRITLLKK